MKNTQEQDFSAYASQGDLAALSRVFQALAPDLRRVARRLAPGSDLSAEDLLQMTFVTAIEKATEFNPGQSLSAWLVGTLALHAKNARRIVSRRGRPVPIEPQMGYGYEPLEGGAGPSELAASRSWLSDVRKAVAKTSPLYQPVLEAVLLNEHTPGEAARLLDLAPGTVRQRLRRGLELLRDGLGRAVAPLFAISLFSQGRAQASMGRVMTHGARVAKQRAGKVGLDWEAGTLPTAGVQAFTWIAVPMVVLLVSTGVLWNRGLNSSGGGSDGQSMAADLIALEGGDRANPVEAHRSTLALPQERVEMEQASSPLETEAATGGVTFSLKVTFGPCGPRSTSRMQKFGCSAPDSSRSTLPTPTSRASSDSP